MHKFIDIHAAALVYRERQRKIRRYLYIIILEQRRKKARPPARRKLSTLRNCYTRPDRYPSAHTVVASPDNSKVAVCCTRSFASYATAYLCAKVTDSTLFLVVFRRASSDKCPLTNTILSDQTLCMCQSHIPKAKGIRRRLSNQLGSRRPIL